MLCISLAALLVTAGASAQRCGCGMGAELHWPARMQRSDGSWPASAAASEDVAEHEQVKEQRPADGGQSNQEGLVPLLPGDAYAHQPQDLHVTALYALALSADGSNLRSGPGRIRLKNAVRWVRGQQDKHGRFGFSVHPDWLVDHALVTTMLAEVAAHSRYSILHAPVDRALQVLRQHLGRVDSADVEVLVWARMATAAGRLMPDAVRSLQAEPARSEFLARLDALDDAVVRLAPAAVLDVDATDRRKVGAGVLLTSLLTDRGAHAPAVDVSWLDSAEHPLATTYYAIASFRAGGLCWKEMSKRLEACMVKSADDRLPFARTWAPRGRYGEAYGRLGMTATSVLTLTLYYRYARLAVCDV